MSKQRNLYRPPIKEAVIEFQFQPMLNFNKEELLNFQEHLKENYSSSQFLDLKKFTFGVQMDKATEVSESQFPFQGIKLEDKTRGFVVHFLKDRLSVSKINSYNNFETLLEEFFKIYSEINNLFKLGNISRIGLRYINEINFPDRFKKYLERTPLVFKKELSGKIKRTYNQSIFEYSDFEGAILNFIVDLKNKKIIVDTDVFNTSIFNPTELKKVNKILDKMRKIKNDIFFQIVSDKLEELL
ncbi:MAG: hypothetical protein HW421_566 [Ignavibacteria bacterium]|nr:hypothetical protein [Ignavibacteria bacterium]